MTYNRTETKTNVDFNPSNRKVDLKFRKGKPVKHD